MSYTNREIRKLREIAIGELLEEFNARLPEPIGYASQGRVK